MTRPPRTTPERALDLWRQVAHLITPKEQSMHWTYEILNEMDRARAKFPAPGLLLTAFTEEAGEVVKAVLDHYSGKGDLADVRKELIQVGAMVGRLLEEGDPIHRLPASNSFTRPGAIISGTAWVPAGTDAVMPGAIEREARAEKVTVKIEDLENLVVSAEAHMRLRGVPGRDEQLLLRNLRYLARELLALWKAAHGEGDHQNGMAWMEGVEHALVNLNSKASLT